MNNAHLCYIYINEYNNQLKDVELVIDCHYNYKYDKEKKTLKITKNKDFPDNFWGKNIFSVTGLVGKNGAGKTTIMRFLTTTLTHIVENAFANCIAIYKDKDFIAYGENDIEISFKDSIIKQNNNNYDSSHRIPCFYHSGHFSPTIIDTNITENSIMETYYASDNILLVEDLQNYYDQYSLDMKLPLIDYLNSHIAQNNYRICMMLANRQLSDIIKDFTFPKYVIIKANQSGAESIRYNKYKPNNKYKNITIPLFKNIYDQDSPYNYILSVLIYNNLINLLYDRYEALGINNDDNDYNIIDKWQESINQDSPILDQFREFIENESESNKNILSPIYDVLKELSNLTLCTFTNSTEPYLYINCEENKENLIALGNKILTNDIFRTAKFFDISYAQSLYSDTKLSSGEVELLNLFSRIYDALYLKENSKSSDNNSPRIIMLDEAEIGFHPDWQRRYINLIIEFLNAMKTIDSNMPDFQIIISTHSPILLSDIPKCSTNYLKRDSNGKTTNASKEEIGETFAANVFDLYRMSFFMGNGLVGEFACKKINDLNTRIDGGEIEGIINEIKMIGDERIQEYLIDKYQKKHPDDESLNKDIIRYYEEKIKQLKNIMEN